MSRRGGLALAATTSTGAGDAIVFNPPTDYVAAQFVRTHSTGAMTFAVQGSLDGSNWTSIVSSTSSTGTGGIVSSTTFPVTHVRVNVSVHASSGTLAVHVAGR